MIRVTSPETSKRFTGSHPGNTVAARPQNTWSNKQQVRPSNSKFGQLFAIAQVVLPHKLISDEKSWRKAILHTIRADDLGDRMRIRTNGILRKIYCVAIVLF